MRKLSKDEMDFMKATLSSPAAKNVIAKAEEAHKRIDAKLERVFQDAIEEHLQRKRDRALAEQAVMGRKEK